MLNVPFKKSELLACCFLITNSPFIISNVFAQTAAQTITQTAEQNGSKHLSPKEVLSIKQESKRYWTRYYPYIPEKIEYNFELGTMWEASTQYWLGANFGFHLGPCMFSPSQTCQQYADLIGGTGGRSGYTNKLLMSSLRWQFTDLKKTFVPHARVLVGYIQHRDEERDRAELAYGLGYGFTTAVHERLDLKFEFRAGSGDQVWSQAFISFSLKFDKFVDYFAKKLESMGVAGEIVSGTAKVTGKVIQGTVETTGKVIKGTIQTTSDIVEGSGKVLSPSPPQPASDSVDPKSE